MLKKYQLWHIKTINAPRESLLTTLIGTHNEQERTTHRPQSKNPNGWLTPKITSVFYHGVLAIQKNPERSSETELQCHVSVCFSGIRAPQTISVACYFQPRTANQFLLCPTNIQPARSVRTLISFEAWVQHIGLPNSSALWNRFRSKSEGMTRGGGGTPIWKGRGCLSGIFVLTRA